MRMFSSRGRSQLLRDYACPGHQPRVAVLAGRILPQVLLVAVSSSHASFSLFVRPGYLMETLLNMKAYEKRSPVSKRSPTSGRGDSCGSNSTMSRKRVAVADPQRDTISSCFGKQIFCTSHGVVQGEMATSACPYR